MKTTEYIKKVEADIKLLNQGWRDKVEYMLPVVYHRPHCESTGNGNACECPIVNEKRSKHVTSPGLLQQLEEYGKHVDLGAEPKAERGSPGKSKSRPPGDMNGFHTLDEIIAEAYTITDRIMREAGRSAEVMPIREVLNQLPYQCRQIVDDYPHLVEDIAHATGRWVDKAQRALGIKTTETVFANTVCGDCGGALAVGRDLRRTDVRCVGTPAAKACGRRYPMSEWVGLYEKGRKS